ncbi:sensor histidine kinase [Oribacterium sp. WCC10]|uniref:sensor histidine kinase n=1 Tax=Oribacterium sp. WCC10 TaxID=1855343 RepID=UPI0008EB4A7A|nr:HAMP domain-containing sensor histidine kinase [Oribacterium sp. WCC10]SFG64188.1 His Kinase A (phospho-acceptor) domain-containing protein [Oribacterium sp. WCC10]
MNEHRIKKLRWKFVMISFSSLLFTMLLIAGLISGTNYYLARKNIRNTLQYIVNNGGYLPGSTERIDKYNDNNSTYDVIRFLNEIFDVETYQNHANPEFYYTTRYFAVLFDSDLKVSKVITNHIAAVSPAEAEVYGETALALSQKFGRYGDYYYQVAELSTGETIVVYLDSSDMIRGISRILYLAMCLILLGIVVAAIITGIFSKWAIVPEIQNMELQKRFLTNASHELKTPLAFIRANNEMMEMLNGESEWTSSTMRQVDRLNGLIQNLVMIARADENADLVTAEECDVTKSVEETVKTFMALAETDGKKLEKKIHRDIKMYASDGQIRQLCSLLIDNAIKYCDPDGTIVVSLSQKGKGIQLVVSNNYKDGINIDYKRFFERFYREDQSHNTDRGGYGIGLSIAESIVEQYKGTINAYWKNDIISFVCILKPLKR